MDDDPFDPDIYPGAKVAGAALRVLHRVAPQPAARIASKLFTTPRRHARPDREIALLRRATPVDVEVAGRRVSAWRWGPARPGATTLLVHGWEARGAQLGAFVRPLVDAGLSVAAFDGPAHGDSEGRSVDFVAFVRALQAVAERVGPLHSIVAHSFGAMAASTALAWGLPAERAVYLAPGVSPLKATRRMGRILGMPPALLERMRENLTAEVGVEWERLEPAVLMAGLGHVALKVLYSRDDEEVPIQAAQALIDHWPGAELELLDGLGHRRILWDPDSVGRTVAFLTEVGEDTQP